MSTQQICDKDCFHCPHPDCVLDTLDADDYRELAAIDRDLQDAGRTERARKKSAYGKAYYKANREKVLAHQKAYYRENREARLAYHKAYVRENREMCAARFNAYRKANLEKFAAYSKAFRARKKAVESRNKD